MARPRVHDRKPSRIGARVKELREACGLSQEALASRAGVSRATIAALELGRYRGTSSQTLEKLATALAVPPSAFHGEPAPIPAALQQFTRTGWGEAVGATEKERLWLGHTAAALWLDVRPTPQALAELLAWRRRHARASSE